MEKRKRCCFHCYCDRIDGCNSSTVRKSWVVADEKVDTSTGTITSSAIQTAQSKSQLSATADSMRWILIFACSIGAAGFLIIGIWNTSRKL